MITFLFFVGIWMMLFANQSLWECCTDYHCMLRRFWTVRPEEHGVAGERTIIWCQKRAATVASIHGYDFIKVIYDWFFFNWSLKRTTGWQENQKLWKAPSPLGQSTRHRKGQVWVEEGEFQQKKNGFAFSKFEGKQTYNITYWKTSMTHCVSTGVSQ